MLTFTGLHFLLAVAAQDSPLVAPPARSSADRVALSAPADEDPSLTPSVGQGGPGPNGPVYPGVHIRCPGLFGLDTNGDTLVRVDPRTGATTVVGSLGINVIMAGMDFAPSGVLWASCRLGNGEEWLVRIGVPPENQWPAQNLAKLHVQLTNGFNGRGLACGPTCDFVYVHDQVAGLFRVDLASGDRTPVGGTGQNAGSMARTPFGYVVYDSPSDTLQFVSELDGAASQKSFTSHDIAACSAVAYAATSGAFYAFDVDSFKLYLIDTNTGASLEIGALTEKLSAMAFGPVL